MQLKLLSAGTMPQAVRASNFKPLTQRPAVHLVHQKKVMSPLPLKGVRPAEVHPLKPQRRQLGGGWLPPQMFKMAPGPKTTRRQGIVLLPRPVPGESRPGDSRNVEKFEKWAQPNFVGRLLLNHWIGNVARKAGLYWPNQVELRGLTRYLERYGDELKNDDVIYPAYFLKSFHGYNSNFASDSVAQQASAMAVIPAIMTGTDVAKAFDERLNKLLRATDCYKQHQGPLAAEQTRRIVDLGCGTGVTTRVLARAYPKAQVVGVDMSWPMLVWAKASTEWPADVFTAAQLEQICLKDNTRDLIPRLSWLHDNAENTRMAAGQMDLATVHFVPHELPERAMLNVAREAYRLLKPGGWFSLIDNDQNVKNLHNGPEFMRQFAGIMAREPHLPEYLREDLGDILAEAGFINVDNVSQAHAMGCTMYMGQKPL